MRSTLLWRENLEILGSRANVVSRIVSIDFCHEHLIKSQNYDHTIAIFFFDVDQYALNITQNDVPTPGKSIFWQNRRMTNDKHAKLKSISSMFRCNLEAVRMHPGM